MANKEILDEQIIVNQGSFTKVRFWVRGKHLGGKIITPDKTWSGDWETEFEETQIRPRKTFMINDNLSDNH
jgi:hypothetical protein